MAIDETSERDLNKKVICLTILAGNEPNKTYKNFRDFMGLCEYLFNFALRLDTVKTGIFLTLQCLVVTNSMCDLFLPPGIKALKVCFL